jgi:hypothetical protein
VNNQLHELLATRLTPEFAPHPQVHIDIPSGWEPVVASLADSLDRLWPNWQFHQIESKLGYLEVYLADPPPDIAGAVAALVTAARREAAHRCERCGTPDGTPQTGAVGGWRMTLCDACREAATRSWLREAGLTDADIAAAGAAAPGRLAELHEVVTVLDVVLVPEEVAVWLHSPRSQLQGASALEAIVAGRARAVLTEAVMLVERSEQ